MLLLTFDKHSVKRNFANPLDAPPIAYVEDTNRQPKVKPRMAMVPKDRTDFSLQARARFKQGNILTSAASK